MNKSYKKIIDRNQISLSNVYEKSDIYMCIHINRSPCLYQVVLFSDSSGSFISVYKKENDDEECLFNKEFSSELLEKFLDRYIDLNFDDDPNYYIPSLVFHRLEMRFKGKERGHFIPNTIRPPRNYCDLLMRLEEYLPGDLFDSLFGAFY